MAISNYSDLQSTVANYLHRGDLTGQIPDFISLAEARLNRKLRLRAMENTEIGTTTGQTISLPTGFIEMKRLQIEVGGQTIPLTYVSPELVGSRESQPVSYSLIGDSIYLVPFGAGYSYNLTYYKRFDPLSSGVNWLITNAPDAYLYGTLVEAATYIKDDAAAAKWGELLRMSVDDLYTADRDDRYGMALQVVAV